ncbi:MAG: aminotransferase class I/II-fold pyridoxal phosphate-dependent enzyme [Eubacteriales bacterium]|nr:aminotransferase class I/II-fold pyridoxal phosphate-dependent enzyme [Eubacteriales bacterium]
MESKFSKESELLLQGTKIDGMDLAPESFPIFQTTAFTWHGLREAQAGYAGMEEGKDFTYIRTCNPNRTVLAQAVSFLEGGEATEICSSGMGAISSTLLTFLRPGDHVIYSNCCYGETLDIFQKLLSEFGVETSCVSFDNPDEVSKEIRPNTKMLYTEVIANPNMNLADIETYAKMAHEAGAMLIVDNTFTTPLAIRPLELGADIVINSLTKFMNGHSDAVSGSVTSTKEIIDKIHVVSMYMGTPGDPFTAWLVLRGLHTLELRVPRQMENAAKLAKALEQNPHVEKVLHPSVKSFPQHELAERMFESDEKMSAMLSIILPEDEDKIDVFLKKLHFAHYVPSLGGVRTSLQHPCTSSHSHMPDAERRAVGITPGMIRISVGIEKAEDLIADFTEALKVFD